jgi:hypothetical protein
VSCAVKQCLILGREGVRSLTTLAIVTVIQHICVVQYNYQEEPSLRTGANKARALVHLRIFRR